MAAVHSISKIPSPSGHADFWPISVSPVLCRILDRIVVRQYIYPSLLCPPYLQTSLTSLHFDQWVNINNLKLNRSKSKEIVFTKPRSCRQTDLPPRIAEDFERVQQISVLGVTLTYNLSMSTHIDIIITSCARVLYGLRTLRSHGMPPPALHAVFQSTALTKVTYAAPVW